MAKKKTPVVSKELNYIRAFRPNSEIADNLNIGRNTISRIAKGETNSTNKIREKIHELYQETLQENLQRQKILQQQAKDKTLSQKERYWARVHAEELGRKTVTREQAEKRQVVMSEQNVPNLPASKYLNNYNHLKSDAMLKKEHARFCFGNKELIVSNYEGTLFFGKKKLNKRSRINMYGIVYANVFSTGLYQIVRDTTAMWPPNLTLKQAIEKGREYFNICFKGENHLEVNVSFLDRGITKPAGAKGRSHGERYEYFSKFLFEREFIGILF